MFRKCGVLTGLACLPIFGISSSSSSFAQEAYYKIEIRKEGLYKIDQAWLNQFGIYLDSIDPRTIRIFNNGGRELPQNIEVPRPADLIENAVFVSGEDDGRFDSEDFILFYARSVHGYDFDPLRKTYQYHLHHYTDQNIYWLVLGGARGKRMRLIDGAPIQPNAIPLAGFRDRLHLEQEKLNPLRAGLTWYWEGIPYGESKYFRFELREPVVNDSSALTIRLQGNPPSFADFQLFLNNFFLGQFSLTTRRPQNIRVSSLGALRNGENVVEVRSLSLAGHVDWLELEYGKNFVAADSQLIFDAPQADSLFEYTISGFADSSIAAFEISQFDDVARIIHGEIAGPAPFRFTFQDSSRSNLPKKYLIAAPSAWLQPDAIFIASPSSLRRAPLNADFIIITHEDFL